ncbi:MAG: hypothetical protein GX335_02435 [Firmicutes bacterium]|nr:hypothetical protein [Bacillota bacterium]
MGYRESLQQAREILEGEIREVEERLAKKEQDLRQLDNLLKEKGRRRAGEQSLTSQIVESLYMLAQRSPEGVPARAVVAEFGQQRQDVNESTIRSTLYQVTRKMRPTEILVDQGIKKVRVLKNGPLYDVELISQEPAEIV